MRTLGALLNAACRLLEGAKARACGPPQWECALFDDVAEFVCDVAETITQSICDLTQVVSQTICDRTTTITETVCDAFRRIPIIGDLICIASRTVSRTVCAASHAVTTTVCLASHLISITACLLGHMASKTVCISWTIVKLSACALTGAGAYLTCAATALLGPGPILRSTTRKVPSVPRTTAQARSFVLATDLLGGADPRMPYDEEGVHVRYRLRNGVGEWSVGNSSFRTLVPAPLDLPPFGNPAGGGALAVSYDRRRLGEWTTPPEFDMIGASSDRVIVKTVGTDEIFILVTGHPYFHRVGERRLVLPQSYFKLDPELGLESARTQDLVAHVTIPGDDERHPATERFPLFRRLFTLGTVSVPLPPLVREVFGIERFNVQLFAGAGELGLMQEMDVRFAPRIWHKADLRPPRNGNDPPSKYPSYEHVVYAANDEAFAEEIARRSVDYKRVLDIGVGLSHYHEQHDNRFGGELDNLTDQPPSILGVPLGLSPDGYYQIANGPIQDYGGWIDGTCIYYLLVQLKRDDEIDVRDPSTLRDGYAILWMDEQSSFTERWRVLHLDDNKFNSPFKPMVAVLTDAADEFYSTAPFDNRRYWCPFTEGHIRSDSRMAVARQFIVVTGIDPVSGGANELYSIHFAWPTMDRTWRWRRFPEATVRSAEGPGNNEENAVVYANDLSLREDSTILLGGSLLIDGQAERGVWFQRFLPADGQEIPAIPEREVNSAGSKPSPSYAHPWDFVAETVATTMNERFSHFGVYEPVHSRVQFYRVTPEARVDGEVAATEAAVWQDLRHDLRHVHQRLDWAAAARILDGGDPAQAIVTRTHPSIYNDPMSFRLVKRPGLGWILMHFDKRDDKLVSFDGIGSTSVANVLLSDRDNPNRTVLLSIDSRLRNDVRQLHGRRVTDEVDAVTPPQVRWTSVTSTRVPNGDVAAVVVTLEMARGPAASNAYSTFDEWLAMNVWRVKLGAILPPANGGGPQVVILFDRERVTDFTAMSPTRFTITWIPTAAEQLAGRLGEILSPRGRIRYGTSVWFVGATGMACCADEIRFENAEEVRLSRRSTWPATSPGK